MELIFKSKATENLKAAELLFENQMYNASVNRAYFAAFHIAVAALAHIGIMDERIAHGTLQAKFNSVLIHKRKVIPGRFKSYMMDLQEMRNTADYDAKSISKKMAERQLKKAKEFVELVLQEISQ